MRYCCLFFSFKWLNRLLFFLSLAYWLPVNAFHNWQDELEAELEELEGAELEEQLLQPATTAPVAPVHVPAGKQPARAAAQKTTATTAEEDELAALQAEMAM